LQDSIGGLGFERRNGDWVGHLLDQTSILEMSEIGISVPVQELDEGVIVSTPDGSAH